MSLFFTDPPNPSPSTPLSIPASKRGIRPCQFEYLVSKLKQGPYLIPETVFLHKGVAQSLVCTEASGTLSFKGTSQKEGVLQLDPIIRDFLRLQRQRQISQVAAVRFLQDTAVRFLTAEELTAMLKNRRKDWMDVLMLQLLPWQGEPIYVNYSFVKFTLPIKEVTQIHLICRDLCMKISDHLYPPTLPQDLVSGDFEFAYFPQSDTLWLLYANNLRTAKKTPKLPESQPKSLVTAVVDKEAIVHAMIQRAVHLGGLVKEYERLVNEQKLLTEESRSFKRSSLVIGCSDLNKAIKTPQVPMPIDLKHYLHKYHMLLDHYKHINY